MDGMHDIEKELLEMLEHQREEPKKVRFPSVTANVPESFSERKRKRKQVKENVHILGVI